MVIEPTIAQETLTIIFIKLKVRFINKSTSYYDVFEELKPSSPFF